ncbi:MAG: ABC transporter substrate-binding protein [Candidatus Binatia bacterium]
MSKHKLKNCYVSVFFIVAFGLVLIPSVRSQSVHTAKLIEGAKKEKKLVWYTSTSVPDASALLKAFNKKYPFVETNLFRASNAKLSNRIMTETRAGRWAYDIVSMSGGPLLRRMKLIKPYFSPESKAYIEAFKEPNGYWTAVYNSYYVIGYNTEMVAKKDAPKDWKDLLDPKWKGKIGMDREEYRWFAAITHKWGREKTQKFMKALAKQDLQWRRGHTLIAQLMISGEFPVSIVYAHRAEFMKNQGAPIEWVNTVKPVVIQGNAISLGAKPEHPHTAKLFIDFVLSKEGQTLVRSFYRIPARSDVKPFSPKMDPSKFEFALLPEDLGTRYKEYVEDFRRIFGL